MCGKPKGHKRGGGGADRGKTGGCGLLRSFSGIVKQKQREEEQRKEPGANP
jgi:hypothetical protein